MTELQKLCFQAIEQTHQTVYRIVILPQLILAAMAPFAVLGLILVLVMTS